MKTISLALLALLCVALSGVSPIFGWAQTTPQANRGTSSQWVSHQMNQPPPDTGNRYQLSEAMIEEIRQLFLQAQKDLGDKSDKQKTAP